MTDGGPAYGEPQFELPTNGGPRVLQFSLLGLFLIVTIPALILAVYFGVGRLAGMSTMEILTLGLGQLLFSVPSLLVWAVGLTIAIRRLKRNRLPAGLAAIAFGGLILTRLILQVVQMVLIHGISSGSVSNNVMSWGLTATGVFYAVSSAAFWILVIAAIFVRRAPDQRDAKASVPTGSPFQADV